MKQTKINELQQEYTSLINRLNDGRSTRNTRNIYINNFIAKFAKVESFKEFFSTIPIQDKVVDSSYLDIIIKKFNYVRKTNINTNGIIFSLNK